MARKIQGVACAGTQRRRLREDEAERDLPNRTTFKTITAPSILITLAMLLLSEPQVIAIIHITRPLQDHERAALLTALVTQLAGRDAVGDGELGRMLARLQRDHFRPPTDAEVGVREAHYQYLDGAVETRLGTDFFRGRRQRQAVFT